MLKRRIDVDALPDDGHPKRFVIFVDHLRGGGAEIITLRLSEALAARGHHVSLFMLSGRGRRLDAPAGVDLVDLSGDADWDGMNIYNWRVSPALQERLNQRIAAASPDIVVLSFGLPYFFSRSLDHGNVWLWIHGESHPRRPWEGSRGLLHLLRFKFFILRSAWRMFAGRRLVLIERGLAAKWPLSWLPLQYVEVVNGMPAPAVAPVAAEKVYDVAFVARLEPEKQPAQAITAFARSALAGRMVVVGDGRLMSELVELVDRLGIAHRVDFTGWCDEPAHYVARSCCLALTSEHEGFGLVLLEALSLGVPVIAYNAGPGVARLLGRFGARHCLIARNDIDAMAKGMAALVASPYAIDRGLFEDYRMDRMAARFSRLACAPRHEAEAASGRRDA